MIIISSCDLGKEQACHHIRSNFPNTCTILDMGACDGKWRRLLPEYPNMDAVEAFTKNVTKLKKCGYRQVFRADIRDFQYEWYDVIIFGDVIEHMSVEQARMVLDYAIPRCKDLIIAVPFLFEQGAIYGNPYEVHQQADLTADVFKERYPEYEVLVAPAKNYRYYHKRV